MEELMKLEEVTDLFKEKTKLDIKYRQLLEPIVKVLNRKFCLLDYGDNNIKLEDRQIVEILNESNDFELSKGELLVAMQHLRKLLKESGFEFREVNGNIYKELRVPTFIIYGWEK